MPLPTSAGHYTPAAPRREKIYLAADLLSVPTRANGAPRKNASSAARMQRAFFIAFSFDWMLRRAMMLPDSRFLVAQRAYLVAYPYNAARGRRRRKSGTRIHFLAPHIRRSSHRFLTQRALPGPRSGRLKFWGRARFTIRSRSKKLPFRNRLGEKLKPPKGKSSTNQSYVLKNQPAF